MVPKDPQVLVSTPFCNIPLGVAKPGNLLPGKGLQQKGGEATSQIRSPVDSDFILPNLSHPFILCHSFSASLLWEKMLPCCEYSVKRSMWQEQPARTWGLLMAAGVILEADPHSVPLEMPGAPACNLWMQTCERPVVTGIRLGCTKICDPQKLWENKCLLF